MPKNSHCFSLFGPPGVIPTCRDSICKSFYAKQIDPDTWTSRASRTPCGTSNPKFSYRIPLIVHYLRLKPCNRLRCIDACEQTDLDGSIEADRLCHAITRSTPRSRARAGRSKSGGWSG